jgi:hypothetical protein
MLPSFHPGRRGNRTRWARGRRQFLFSLCRQLGRFSCSPPNSQTAQQSLVYLEIWKTDSSVTNFRLFSTRDEAQSTKIHFWKKRGGLSIHAAYAGRSAPRSRSPAVGGDHVFVFPLANLVNRNPRSLPQASAHLPISPILSVSFMNSNPKNLGHRINIRITGITRDPDRS